MCSGVTSEEPDREYAAASAEIEAKLKSFDGAGGWAGPNELLVTSGRK